jgi:hypothetical protein
MYRKSKDGSRVRHAVGNLAIFQRLLFKIKRRKLQ